MKQLGFILAAAVLSGSGCAADTNTNTDKVPDAVQQTELGGLSLALRSTDSQGRDYRLRGATFTIQQQYYWGYDGGVPSVPTPTVLSTETDIDSPRLTTRLVPGQYLVTLGGDWYIERLTPTGQGERVEQVVLLTEATQYTYIDNGWTTDVEYRFGVDGTLIDFRHGDLNIDIGIELPGDQPADAGWGWPFPPIYDASTPPTRDAGVVDPVEIPRDGGV